MNTQASIKLLQQIVDVADKAGVSQKMFIGFGTLLGCIRDRKLIEHDDDLDMCFLPMNPGEKEKYFIECQKARMFDGWKYPEKRVAKTPDGEILWFSVTDKEAQAKSCNWFFLDWNNYLWHTKGKLWVSDLSFNPKLGWKPQDQALMLGAKKEYFEELVEVNLESIKVNAPSMAGTLCDFYYPNWFTPKEGGASAQDHIARVPDFLKPETWEIIK
jgi:hypothetical protein